MRQAETKMALADVERLSAERVVNTYPGTAEDQSGTSPLKLPTAIRFLSTSAKLVADNRYLFFGPLPFGGSSTEPQLESRESASALEPSSAHRNAPAGLLSVIFSLGAIFKL